MEFDLSDHHRDLQARARVVAVEFANRAAEHDASGVFPKANFENLRDAGLLTLAFDGGPDGRAGDYLGFALVVAEIGRACASTALCFTMHHTGVAAVIDATQDQRSRFESGVRGGQIWSVAFSEPGSGSHFLRAATRAKRVEGGYLLNGQKFFVTGIGGADRLVTHAVVEGTPPDALTTFALSTASPGVEVAGEWDAMGMRANDSRSVRYQDVFVPDEDRLGAEGEGVARITSKPPHVTLGVAATNVGIAEASLQAAIEHASTRVIAGTEVPLSRYQAVRFSVAEIAMTVDQMRLMLLYAAWLADHRPDESRMALERAKYVAATGAFEAANKALQITGGRGYLRGAAVERYVRDARAAALMANTTEQVRDMVGAALLGLDGVPEPA